MEGLALCPWSDHLSFDWFYILGFWGRFFLWEKFKALNSVKASRCESFSLIWYPRPFDYHSPTAPRSIPRAFALAQPLPGCAALPIPFCLFKFSANTSHKSQDSCLPQPMWFCSLLLFFFFFKFFKFYGHTCGIWKFLGQELNSSHSCDLCGSCGNTGSFDPLCGAGD